MIEIKNAPVLWGYRKERVRLLNIFYQLHFSGFHKMAVSWL
jgi:hypothetical protein